MPFRLIAFLFFLMPVTLLGAPPEKAAPAPPKPTPPKAAPAKSAPAKADYHVAKEIPIGGGGGGGDPNLDSAARRAHNSPATQNRVVDVGNDQTLKARWPLKPCEEPSGMAIDRKHHRLLIGCSNKLAAVMDTESGKVVTTVPIGDGVDANAFDPGTSLGFSSNGDGTLTVIKEETPDKFAVAETVPTRRGARTMALDEKTHIVYLATAKFGPPPAATAEQPRPRPSILPDSFVILVV